MTDFIQLATSSRWLIDRALGEDDDFARLENTPSAGGASSYPDDSILKSTQYYDSYNSFGGGEGIGIGSTAGGISSSDITSHPFLSKSAEAELYLLATNFLLYVAMVIITTMIAKIYFPESLERAQVPPSIPRNYSYHRRRTVVLNKSSDDEEYDDDVDHHDDDDRYIDDEEYYNPNTTDDDEEEVLYSDEEEFSGAKGGSPKKQDGKDNDDDEEEDLVDALLKETNSHHTGGSGGSGGGNNNNNNTHRVTILEFDQTQTSRHVVLQRLLGCSLMLNITFVTWGALQERMLTRRYPRHTGDYFTYSYALVFTNRFWTLIMSGLLLWYLKPRLSRTTVLYEYSFPSISNMLSSWCQYEALRYVSFPATTLFKSFKLAPVMLMGKILGNKTYPAYDYFVAFLIGVGIALFMTSTDGLDWKQDYLGGSADGSKWTGIMLLGLFLFFDSFTSQFQSRMFQRHVDLSMVELMFATSAYSTVLSAITLVHTHELSAALEFVYEHSEIHLHFFFFSICSTIGQLFIFYTIKNFGAVVFTLIMTTRILLSIALSCVMYGHHVSAVGVLGLMTVLGAVLYRIKRKAEGTQLIKWQGMEDDKGRELVQEWHEHVDM